MGTAISLTVSDLAIVVQDFDNSPASRDFLDSFRAYGRHVGISATLVIGGVSMGAQVRALLNGVDVLVATPGRLLDLVQSNALRLGEVEFLVLDEADRMLDMGFLPDVERILRRTPRDRQTALFSATVPTVIRILSRRYMHDPAVVHVQPQQVTVEEVDKKT